MLLTGCTPWQSETRLSGESDGSVTLVFWKFRSNKEDYIIDQWIDQWNRENPHAQVRAEYVPYSDYLSTSLATAFATNSAPDIYMISAGSFLKYADAGFMLPLDGYMSDALKDDILPNRLQAATEGGGILGMPIEIEPVGLYYNKELFSRHGLTPPKTWDEMLRYAALFDDQSMAGTVLPGQPNDYQNFIFYTFFLQAGGSFDFTRETLEEPLLKALTFWRELSRYSQPSQSTIQIPSDIYPLATEEASMQVCGYWAVRQLEKSFPDFPYGVVPVPAPEAGGENSVYGGWFMIVNPHSAHAAEAARFTVWMWGEAPERPLAWCREVSSKVPCRQSVLDVFSDSFSSPIDKVFLEDILPHAVPEPKLPPEIAKAFENAVQEAMFGSADLQAVAHHTTMEILKRHQERLQSK